MLQKRIGLGYTSHFGRIECNAIDNEMINIFIDATKMRGITEAIKILKQQPRE